MAERSFNVLIVGGGFSGTMLAVQLMRRNLSLAIAVVDKASRPGRGLAYGTEHLSHLLNVPAGQMTALPEEPDHFVRWAQANYSSTTQSGSFLPRLVYGRYIESLFDDATSQGTAENPKCFKDEAIGIGRSGSQFVVQLEQGEKLVAEVVVLATGNLPPSNPRIPGLPATGQPALPSAWSRDALDGIPQAGSVLLIGSGLTAVDVAVALDAKGYGGNIHVVSRHGLLPQCHKRTEGWRQFWHEGSPRTTRELFRLIRDEVEIALAEGVDWRTVIDTLRPVTQEIWKSLGHAEKTRFLRHVRAYWDTHRHRVAPEIDNTLNRLKAEGRLHIYAGRITNYAKQPNSVEVTLRLRGSEQQKRLSVDRVINCTGSETDCRRVHDRLLKSLFVEGLARPDDLFLGLNVNAEGFVLDFNGIPSRSLCAIGPPTKGGLWEAVAVPELRRQASELAEHLVRRFSGQANAPTDKVVARV